MLEAVLSQRRLALDQGSAFQSAWMTTSIQHLCSGSVVLRVVGEPQSRDTRVCPLPMGSDVRSDASLKSMAAKHSKRVSPVAGETSREPQQDRLAGQAFAKTHPQTDSTGNHGLQAGHAAEPHQSGGIVPPQLQELRRGHKGLNAAGDHHPYCQQQSLPPDVVPVTASTG